MSRAPDVPHRLLVVSHPAVLPVNQLVYAELGNLGWDVEIVAPARWRHEFASSDFAARPLPDLAKSFHAIPVAFSGRPQRHFYWANPLRMLRALRPGVVFVEQEAFSAAAVQWGIAARMAHVPFGVQADENLERSFPVPVRAGRRWVLRHCAFVAARSPTAGRLVESWGGLGEIHLIPHHVPGWVPQVRLESEKFRVGFAGRLVAEKGLDILVKAVTLMDGPRELVVAGDGPMREWLQMQDLNGAGLRLLTGLSHEEMPTAYSHMDILVLPSRSTPTWVEQFGRVLVEALWCGIPVVGSRSGEIPWVIETTGGGMLFPEGDHISLANLLIELRDNKAVRAELAAVGGSRVQELFSVGAVASELSSMLKRVIAQHSSSMQ